MCGRGSPRGGTGLGPPLTRGGGGAPPRGGTPPARRKCLSPSGRDRQLERESTDHSRYSLGTTDNAHYVKSCGHVVSTMDTGTYAGRRHNTAAHRRARSQRLHVSKAAKLLF